MIHVNAPSQVLYRRPAVARLLIIALLAEIGYAVLNISTMPVYLKFDRGFGASLIGLVIVAFLLSEAIFKGPMGAAADRIGRKRLIVLGPCLTVATSLLSMAVPESWNYAETFSFIVLRILDGLGAAMLWPAAFALIGDSVEDHERQQAMSLLNMCYLLGVALALPIGGIMNDLFGSSLASSTGSRSPGLFLAAGLFLAVTIFAAVKLPAHIPHHHSSDTEAEHQTGLRELLHCVKSIPEYLFLAIVTFAGIGFPMAIIKLFAEQQFDMSESKFGALVLPAAIGMAAFSVPMSKYGERMGRYRAVHWGLGFCTAGLVLIALGAVIPWLRSPWFLAIAGVPVGFGFLLTIPAWMASVSDIDPRKRGVNLGAVMTAQGIGAIIGAPIGSILYEKLQPVGLNMGFGESFGRYSPFVGCAICVGIGWLISLRILREK